MKSVDLLAEQVMELPIQQQLLLVNRVLASVDSEEDPHIRDEWEREIRARMERLDQDPSMTISGPTVFAELDAKLQQ